MFGQVKNSIAHRRQLHLLLLRFLLPVLLLAAKPCATTAAFSYHPSGRHSQRPSAWRRHQSQPLAASTSSPSSSKASSSSDKNSSDKGDNSAMKFLRRIGKVGGSANRDFRYAIGVDEGSSGKSMGDAAHQSGSPASSHASAVLRKSQAAYPSCTGGGIIDDLREPFPVTTIGTSWSGFTDQVMGGHSMAVLVRSADYRGRPANVLTGRVRNLPGQPEVGGAAGFVQMATNLNGQSSSSSFVDASRFDGVEVDVACSAASNENGKEYYESFNVQYVVLSNLAPLSEPPSFSYSFLSSFRCVLIHARTHRTA
jgi:Complex I intermediate-associated protein 30 (CIA30)